MSILEEIERHRDSVTAILTRLGVTWERPGGTAEKSPNSPPPVSGPSAVQRKMTWREAAERLNRLRVQGEPWPGHAEMARRFGCSQGTTHKAVRKTPELHIWAKCKAPAGHRAQSLNDVVLDRTAQARELDPADQVTIREYLERDDLTAEERAFFNGLSQEDQLDFLNDPDRLPRVLGRKP